jgi:ankyrin repeat protein
MSAMTEAFVLLEKNDSVGLDQLLTKHPELINVTTYFAGGTLLHFAAGESDPKSMQVLVKHGFDIDKRGQLFGDAALQTACANGRLENAKLLLDLGAAIDTSESFRNPLFAAIYAASPETVELLLTRGIDPTIRYTMEDGAVMDALGFARKRGEDECERVLLSESESRR